MNVSHMAGLDLNLALVLHALLAERSVSRAAKRLGVSQSAASHALSRLRAVLGDPLVLRGPRGVLPTARAETMAAPLATALELLEKALLAPPVFDAKTTARSFRIATTDYAEYLLLPRFLGALASEAPSLDVWVRPFEDDPAGAFERGELDLAIGLRSPDWGSAQNHTAKLLDEQLVGVVRQGHPLTRGRLTVERFAAAKHLLIAPRGRPGGFVDSALSARGLERHIAVAVPHFLAAPRVVVETDLVLTVARRIAESFAGVLPLRILALPFDVPTIEIAMLWHRRHDEDPAHLWFRNRLSQIAASLATRARPRHAARKRTSTGA